MRMHLSKLYIVCTSFKTYVLLSCLLHFAHVILQYAAVNAAGSNLVIAGRAGFALYSGSRRKWKLFGNEVQEQSLVC